MIIVAGGTKGGSGKTTLATNLIVMRAAEGRDVLLVDADDQESATDFTMLRTERLGSAGYTAIKLTGNAVRNETLKLAKKCDDVVIDVGGRDTASQRAALSIATVVVVPVVPRSFDVWALEKVALLIKDTQVINPEIIAYTFINRADPSGTDNEDAAELLQETEELLFIDTPLGARKVFGKAAAQGLAVSEYEPPDEKAVSEMTALFRMVFLETSQSKVANT